MGDDAHDLAPLAAELESRQAFAAAILFGSAARGTMRPDSDVDVAVLYAGPAARESIDRTFLEVLGTLGIAAGRDVHLIDLENVDAELRRSIFAKGRVLFDRSEGRLKRLLEQTLIEYFDWEYARRVQDAALDSRLARARGRP